MTTPSVLPTLIKRTRVPGIIDGLTKSSPVDILAKDLFTGADTTALTSHTMDVGAGWSALTGSITIVSNTAVCQSSVSCAVTECSRQDVTVYCDIKAPIANANYAPTIVLRAYDYNNLINLYFSGDGVFTVYNKENGSSTAINTGSTWPADTNWHSVKAICEDTKITVYLDNTLLCETYVARNAGGTKYGILGFSLSGSKDSFDNFRVEANRRLRTYPDRFISNIVNDPFTGADNTRLNTMGWTEHLGTWQISSNKATQTLNSGSYVVTKDVGISNLALECAITTPAVSGFISGIVWRAIDRWHFVEAELNSNFGGQGGFGVWYADGTGAMIEVVRAHYQTFTPANNTTYTLRVTVDGEWLKAEVVEASLKIYGRCNKFMSATRAGLFELRDGNRPNANLYDNFKVYNG